MVAAEAASRIRQQIAQISQMNADKYEEKCRMVRIHLP